MIPKPGGGERPLGIPTIRDRVVQTAVKLVIEPIFEADLDDSAYGYRPKRGAADAIKEVHRLVCRGYSDVVDADLSKYFDTIPHAQLMQSVARRIVDRQRAAADQAVAKAPVEERDGDGNAAHDGRQDNNCGTPQGGVISPLLANLYMNRFLKHWRATGKGEAFRAHIVNYADDFVILSRGHAAEALAWTRQVMTRLGLTLNEAKTSRPGCPAGAVRLPWIHVRPAPLRKDGHWYLGASPSRKSVQRIKDKVGDVLVPGNKGAMARGARSAQQLVEWLVDLLRLWHPAAGVPGSRQSRLRPCAAISSLSGTRCRGAARRQFPRELVFGEIGVLALRRVHLATPWASRRNQSESRMREIGTSGSMSGEGKRSDGQRPSSQRASPQLYRNLSASGLRISESCCAATTLRETEGIPDGDGV